MIGTGAADWVRSAVMRFERPLISYAAHLAGDADRARDIVQEAFLRLCGQAEADVGPHLAEWLFRVCRNLAIDARRRERRVRSLAERQAEELPSLLQEPSLPAEQEDLLASVHHAMQGLTANQREVIRLKFQHGMSYKQISEVTSLSVTNVGFLIHTGLKLLRESLAGESAPTVARGSRRR